MQDESEKNKPKTLRKSHFTSFLLFLFPHLVNPDNGAGYGQGGGYQAGDKVEYLGKCPVNIPYMQGFDGAGDVLI